MTILGARPQFIKAAPVSKVLSQAGHNEFIVHTGQHYDYGMSQVFFDELGIPDPNVNLCVGSGSHAWQTGQMLIGIGKAISAEKPNWVLVYGDTNSTLAGALAASKLRVPLAHIESGLRSFNREMPEEYNRVLSDHCSDLLFCPTLTAVNNLAREGITEGVHLVGDTMYDALLYFKRIAKKNSTILRNLNIKPKEYLLATVHRPYNTDDPDNLTNILSAFIKLDVPIIFPVHPRTRKCIERLDGRLQSDRNLSNVRLIDPLSYLDMLVLEENARVILTDSGGMQKEAYFLRVPCVTIRPETEWIETVRSGWNVVVGTDPNKIVEATYKENSLIEEEHHVFGRGDASMRIVKAMNAIK
jgi:UDP-N-acetylglucosamine 2-epimerase